MRGSSAGLVERAGAGDVALVAGGGHDEDAGAPGLLDREGERVHGGALRAVGAVGEEQDAHVEVPVVAVLHDPIDRGDHLRHVDAAVGGADLEAQDPRVGGHAEEVRRVARVGAGDGVAAAAGDDAGEERAVAVRVEVPHVRVLRLEAEVGPVDDLARRREALHRDHARVDDRDVDPGAGVAGAPPVGDPGVGVGAVHRVRVGRGGVGRGRVGARLRARQRVDGRVARCRVGARLVGRGRVGGRGVGGRRLRARRRVGRRLIGRGRLRRRAVRRVRHRGSRSGQRAADHQQRDGDDRAQPSPHRVAGAALRALARSCCGFPLLAPLIALLRSRLLSLRLPQGRVSGCRTSLHTRRTGHIHPSRWVVYPSDAPDGAIPFGHPPACSTPAPNVVERMRRAGG